MIFAIITHVPHLLQKKQYFAYAPYVREMNSWIRNADEVILVAPIAKSAKTPIDASYKHENIELMPIAGFDVLSLKTILLSIYKIPKISWQIYKAMQKADHIHLRCPGNIGLLGCLVQILFPAKPKTAKYAGNWDPKAKQPWTYKLQKWILSNIFITRNMQVLVYGEWKNQSKNIVPFFTATYAEADKKSIKTKDLKRTLDFVFVGVLVAGKNTLYAIQLVEKLAQKGFDVRLTVFGEGIERDHLERYVALHNLAEIVFFKGNQNQEVVKMAYQDSHFVVLPSKSEGWPKAIAEGMFWGCVPLATSVSCVPFMLDYGNRGTILTMDLEKDAQIVQLIIENQVDFDLKSQGAINWSTKYTVDIFEQEIKKIILNESSFKN
ncbi:glycosyltransferase [Flavobacterium sp. XN-5]|uniref:glycosyltransferase n=1 Tax=Flavobacterium sp. XN-5 TaxID=2599390 RepID=UPI0011C94ADE|nr:glycosyltransferase [Flavobacterium sp. XN-5]NGY37465.1 glycosyltransferase [Flavobacterium sp. XN-5]